MMIILLEAVQAHIFPFSSAIFLSSLVAASVYCWQRNLHNVAVIFASILALSFLGAGVGLIAGLSRVGVAGAVLPAALTFLGAAAGALLIISNVERAFLASVAILAFSISLTLNYYFSAVERSRGENLRVEAEIKLDQFKRIQDKCLKIILDVNFHKIPLKEQKRNRAYCRKYIPFLQ